MVGVKIVDIGTRLFIDCSKIYINLKLQDAEMFFFGLPTARLNREGIEEDVIVLPILCLRRHAVKMSTLCKHATYF